MAEETVATPVPVLNGHCVSQGRPDQYHDLCPVRWTTVFGVEQMCSCPNHEQEQGDV